MTRDITWKTGQRIVAGFEGFTVPEALKRLIRTCKVGNIILFRRNVESATQLYQLCSELQELVMAETGLPALIAIDQEGGAVSRLPQECASAPCAMAVASTGDVENAYQSGLLTGRTLNALGINFDLAPVMDTNSNPGNPVIGVRSFGDQPETVAHYGCAVIRGLEQSVLSCAKHFPGHGDTEVDSHLGLPVVDKSLDQLEACELVPFRAAAEAGVSAIMTTHILFPQIEKENVPATMSKAIVQGILRQRLGFQGLVISDCMMMQAIARFYGTVQGSLAAINAGVDLVCISHDPALAGEVGAAAMAGADPRMMDECVARIVAVKQALLRRPRLPMSAAVDPRALRAVQQQRAASVCLVGSQELAPLGGRPFFVGCQPFHTSQAADPLGRFTGFAEYLQSQLGGTSLVTPVEPGAEEIAKAVAGATNATSIVLCTYNAHIRREQLALMQALGQTGKPLIVCAMGNPYDLSSLPQGACGLTAFEYSADMLRILRDVLTGAYKPAGTLSVKL